MPNRSKIQTELDLLATLEDGEVVTQMTLSKRHSVSIGLVNALLKRAIHKGFVKAKAAPYKRFAYFLTPKGFSEKSQLVAQFLEASLDFFRTARQQYGDLFERARMSNMNRIAFIGSGELVEIALLAAREVEIEIIAILDRETNKERLYGLRVVRNLEDISPIDAVVITDSRAPQAAFDSVRDQLGSAHILAPALLRITRVPLGSRPKV